MSTFHTADDWILDIKLLEFTKWQMTTSQCVYRPSREVAISQINTKIIQLSHSRPAIRLMYLLGRLNYIVQPWSQCVCMLETWRNIIAIDSAVNNGQAASLHWVGVIRWCTWVTTWLEMAHSTYDSDLPINQTHSCIIIITMLIKQILTG